MPLRTTESLAKNALDLWARRVGKNALRGPAEKADALVGQKTLPLLWMLSAHGVPLRAKCSCECGDCGQKALNGQGCPCVGGHECTCCNANELRPEGLMMHVHAGQKCP